jgi:hypothetical protein
MRTITLTTPRDMRDTATRSEFDADTITTIKPVGDDDKPGTNIMVAGSFEVIYCRESARQIREMIEEAKAKEEVRLDAETADLLALAAKSADAAIHFIPCDGELGVVIDKEHQWSFTGRQRSRYERIRGDLEASHFIISRGEGRYDLTERGYALGDHLAAMNTSGQLFHGFVTMPPAPKPTPNFAFKQHNYNRGDVNNAFSEQGAVIQNVRAKSEPEREN